VGRSTQPPQSRERTCPGCRFRRDAETSTMEAPVRLRSEQAVCFPGKIGRAIYCLHALSRESPGKIGKGMRTYRCDRKRNAREGLYRRRRIPLRHGAGTLKRNGGCDLGRDLFLRSAARRGATVLGRIFRPPQREGRAFPAKLPARKRNGAMGLLRL
jgi:hypothetical protein